MISKKLAFLATTTLMGNAVLAAAASAQSTGTLANESNVVVVTGTVGPASAGAAVAQTVDKTRSTIDQDTIERQNPGQTIIQTLNLAPGINFTNADPYGNSGGNLRVRGFDGNRVGLAFDGVPLNDTGNYATFTNQLLDPEVITQASVNQGTTDADSPTAAAIGGIVNFVSAIPHDEMGIEGDAAFGDFNYNRYFLRADSGALGPWGTTAYVTGSYTHYDKFKGPGDLMKAQVNGKVYQDLGGKNFIAAAFHYNRNRNFSYNNFATLAQFNTGYNVTGGYFENDIACARSVGVNGTSQNENTQSTRILSDGSTALGSCTNYAALRNNPSDTGNVRVNFSYELLDGLRLTVDPSFQYVMANGGGFTVISERDNRLDLNTTNGLFSGTCNAGANVNGGVDINGDGDSCDNVTTYTPSNTNTRRYGVLASLIWDMDDSNRFRVSYSNDYGRHRQTGEAGKVTQAADPIEVFGGKETWGDPNIRIVGVDGSFLRSRDRFSLAILNQLSLDWRGEYLDGMLTVNAGVRDPIFERELSQYCYTQNGLSTVLCTTQTPVGFTVAANGAITPNAGLTTGPNGNVTFIGDTNSYVEPFHTKFKYDKVLPNVAVGVHLGDSTIYGSYSEQIAVPRTDNLYTVSRSTTAATPQPIAYNSVDPEFSKNYEAGYRFTTGDIVASAAVFLNQYSNRVVSTLDNDPTSETFNTTIDRNVGKVESKGFEGSVGWQVLDNLSLYASATLLDARLQEDQIVGSFTCQTVAPFTNGCSTTTAGQRYALILPTKDKKVVETPEQMVTLRGDWDVIENLSVGLQGKYVGERFTTDVNDEVIPSYTVFDFDARYDFGSLFNVKSAYIQLNVSNFTDEKYPVNISSGTNALQIDDVNPDPAITNLRTGAPRTFGISAPQVTMVTLGARF